jgi:hypothetical protein
MAAWLVTNWVGILCGAIQGFSLGCPLVEDFNYLPWVSIEDLTARQAEGTFPSIDRALIGNLEV